MRLMPGSGYFYSTTIRNGSYKLVVNGSRNAANRQIGMHLGYWLNPVATHPLLNPNDAGYASLGNDSMFRSVCYDAMSADEQNENETFAVAEYMLFDLETDPIE